MARRLLCAVHMLRVRRRTQTGQFRALAVSLFGVLISGAAALSTLGGGEGLGHWLLGAGLLVIAWRYCRSVARTALRLRDARHLEAAMQDTGRVLEKLGGYELLRRLVGTPGKQEHVAVGPNGIFVVTTRRGRRGPTDAAKNGRANQYAGGLDPVEESRIEAACVAERIFRRLGYRPRVQPVLCFPQALVAVGEKRRGVMIVTAPTVTRAIQGERGERHLAPQQIESIVQALVDPLPVALPPSPSYLRLMPRPVPRQ